MDRRKDRQTDRQRELMKNEARVGEAAFNVIDVVVLNQLTTKAKSRANHVKQF